MTPSNDPGHSPSPATNPADRLAYEWRHLQRAFAYHPHVRIVPLEGDPPHLYEVQYTLRTLIVNPQGALDYADKSSVILELTDEFPRVGPIVRPGQAIFHPNVDSQFAQILPPWQPMNSLTDVVQRIGKLLAFQNYDASSVVNPVAHQWVIDNAAYIPTDAGANLDVNAGGKPIERIARSGAVTLAALKDQLRSFAQSLLNPLEAPPPEDVADFAHRTRLAAGTFLSGDVPDELVSAAEEVYFAAEALPGLLEQFERLGSVDTVLSAARLAGTELSSAALDLDNRIANLVKAINLTPDPEPASALEQLPSLESLQKSLGSLQVALVRTEKAYFAALASARSLDFADEQSVPLLLEDILRAAREKNAPAADEARKLLTTALAGSEDTVTRGRSERGVLERLVWWREYAQLVHRTVRVTKQVVTLGPAAVQAYYMVNDAGAHGPFEFEQEIDTGAMKLAVHPIEPAGIELIDAQNGRAMGRSKEGKTPVEIRVVLPGVEPGVNAKTAFRPTPTCEALWLQLEYARKQAESILHRLTEAPALASYPATWTGAFLEALSSPVFHENTTAQQATASAQWAALSADLHALAPFKERLATYHLLVRLSEHVPEFLAGKEEGDRLISQANERLKSIMSKASVDTATGQTVIPAKLRAEYETLLANIEKQDKRVARLNGALKLAAAHLKQRVTSPLYFGAADLPHLTAVGVVPEEWHAYPAALADDQILALVQSVEDQLGVQFLERRPVAAAAEAIEAPPAAPAPATIDTAVAEDHDDVEEASVAEAAAQAEPTEPVDLGDHEHAPTRDDDVIEGWPFNA